MKNICIILARQGSKRLPDKNKKEFLGKPIIEYSIETAKKVMKMGLIDKIIISSDDDSYSKYADKCINLNGKYFNFSNTEILFHQRSNETNKDNSTMYDAYREIIKDFQLKDYNYILGIYACAPLLLPETIRLAYLMMLHKSKTNCIPYDPWVFEHTGDFFWQSAKEIIDNTGISQPINEYKCILSQEYQDIDTVEDWKEAENKYIEMVARGLK